MARGTGETAMKCVICKQGEIAPGQVTVALERGATAAIAKDTPGDREYRRRRCGQLCRRRHNSFC